MAVQDMNARAAITDQRENSVVVEASAGTGKTTLLTDRVVSMVREGVPLESLAVVTFNDTAASELRLRIREKLAPELRKSMDQAWICTMHSFASRVLREYYHLCRGVPEFSTEAGHYSRQELGMLWDVFLSGQTQKDVLAESAEALRYPGSETLLDLAGKLEEYRWVDNSSPLGDTAEQITSFFRQWPEKLSDLANLCGNPSDKLHRNIVHTIDVLKNGSTAGIPINVGMAANWSGADALRDVKDTVKLYRSEASIVDCYQNFHHILPAVDRIVIPFLNWLRGRWDSDPTRLSYDDLIYLASKAIEESGTLRAILNDRFTHVFIDEFQDTSLIQVKLFSLILENTSLYRKLTVVGDPKQSIYGWRDADIETYKDTVSKLESGGAYSDSIQVNFRSEKSIVRFVNSFGQALFANPSDGEKPFTSKYNPIQARPEAGEGAGVHLHVLPDADAGSTARAQGIRIAELMCEGNVDRNSTAILFRTKTHMEEVLKELEDRNINYRVAASRDFHTREEVIDTAALIRSILSTEDKYSLVETLRSVYFGIDDIEISRWILQDVQGEKLKHALQLIEQLRTTARNVPPGIFMRTLLQNTCILPLIKMDGYQAGRRLANMRSILEKAESIADYPLLLETLEGTAPVSEEEPSAPPDDASSAVTVSTMHSAKGLAWKHVIVANPGNTSFKAGGSFPRKGIVTNTVLADPRTARIGLRVGNAYSSHYPDLESRELNRAAAEYRRLLYVAVTRPRERLDIFIPDGAKPGTPAGILEAALVDSELYYRHSVELPESVDDQYSHIRLPEPSFREPFNAIMNLYPPEVDIAREKALQLGTELHRVMEIINMDQPEDWLAFNEDLLRNTLEYPQEVIELAALFFQIYKTAGAEVIGREYPILAGGRQYYIDLLLERNGVLESIDYKTDSGDLDERVEFYREHQQLYIRELEKATCKPVKAFLVFLKHRQVVEIEKGSG